MKPCGTRTRYYKMMAGLVGSRKFPPSVSKIITHNPYRTFHPARTPQIRGCCERAREAQPPHHVGPICRKHQRNRSKYLTTRKNGTSEPLMVANRA